MGGGGSGLRALSRPRASWPADGASQKSATREEFALGKIEK